MFKYNPELLSTDKIKSVGFHTVEEYYDMYGADFLDGLKEYLYYNYESPCSYLEIDRMDSLHELSEAFPKAHLKHSYLLISTHNDPIVSSTAPMMCFSCDYNTFSWAMQVDTEKHTLRISTFIDADDDATQRQYPYQIAQKLFELASVEPIFTYIESDE